LRSRVDPAAMNGRPSCGYISQKTRFLGQDCRGATSVVRDRLKQSLESFPCSRFSLSSSAASWPQSPGSIVNGHTIIVLDDAKFHQQDPRLKGADVPGKGPAFGTNAVERIRGKELKCFSCTARHAGRT
jgi:hypothetical protein